MSAADPVTPPGYRCEPADLARDREEILSIWRGNLGNETSLAAKYDWFYTNSEAGSPVASLLCHAGSGRHVGFAAAGPRRATWNGRDVRIGVLVDMAVAPEHRSLFPALLLQRSLQQSVPGELAALYGFPNPKAAPVFARVGYTKTLEVPRLVRVLRSGTYLRRYMPGWAAGLLSYPVDLLMTAWDCMRGGGRAGLQASWRKDADPRADALWSEAQHGAGPIMVRDTRFLRWRFDQKPGPACRYLVVQDDGGRLVAWFACEDDGGTLVVRDFWTRDGCARLDASVVWMLLREAKKAGYAAVSLEFGGSAGILRSLEKAGFSVRSRRPYFTYLGPQPPHAHESVWYVTSADEDE